MKGCIGQKGEITTRSFLFASVQFETGVRQSFEILSLFSTHSTSHRSLFSVVESGILGFGIQDCSGLGIQYPPNDWNPESRARDSGSKFVLDYLTGG